MILVFTIKAIANTLAFGTRFLELLTFDLVEFSGTMKAIGKVARKIVFISNVKEYHR